VAVLGQQNGLVLPISTSCFQRSSRNSSDQSAMERRANPRKPVLMSGAIEFAGRTINCLISNMSISGAALEVTNSSDVPERFSLFFKADGTRIPCHDLAPR